MQITRCVFNAVFISSFFGEKNVGYFSDGCIRVVVHKITRPRSSPAKACSNLVLPPLPITAVTPGLSFSIVYSRIFRLLTAIIILYRKTAVQQNNPRLIYRPVGV